MRKTLCLGTLQLVLTKFLVNYISVHAVFPFPLLIIQLILLEFQRLNVNNWSKFPWFLFVFSFLGLNYSLTLLTITIDQFIIKLV